MAKHELDRTSALPFSRPLALAGLLTGATVWGVVWYPFRLLDAQGVGGVPATTLVYAIALLLGLVFYRRTLREVSSGTAILMWLGLAAGWTNLAYVLAVIHGEVVRILLLFYLAPLWTVFFARYLLQEELTRIAFLIMALALGGAMVMLWHPDMGMPWPKNWAEWISITAGISFALTNVLSRKAAQFSIQLKSLAVWGGVLVVALLGSLIDATQWQSVIQAGAISVFWLLLIGLAIFIATVAMQYGLTHTPANQAIVILLFELVVVAITSYYWANEALSLREWVGGAMIVAASFFAGKMEMEMEKPA